MPSMVEGRERSEPSLPEQKTRRCRAAPGHEQVRSARTAQACPGDMATC
jgi:hypothetical protein